MPPGWGHFINQGAYDDVRIGPTRRRQYQEPPGTFSGPGWQGPTGDRTVTIDNGVNVSDDRVGMLDQLISSNRMGTGDWNAARDLRQNLYNRGAASAAEPWQGTYYGQQPSEKVDTVSTGSEQQKLPWTPQMQQALGPLVRQFGSASPQSSYGYGAGSMLVNGERIPGGGPELAQAMAQASNRGPRTEDQRWAAADQYLSSRGVEGLQKNQLLTHLFGEDPLHRQARQHDWMQQAKTFQDAHRKAQLDEYQTWAKTAEGDPEDILSTFGKNPQLPSAYYRPGRNLAPDPLNPAEVRQIPGGWTNVSGATVHQLQRLRASLGLNDEAANASLAARMHELLAKAASDGGAQLAGFNQPTDYGAESAQYAHDSLPAGVRHRQAIAGAFGSIPARIGNAASQLEKAELPTSTLNYLSQLFGGKGELKSGSGGFPMAGLNASPPATLPQSYDARMGSMSSPQASQISFSRIPSTIFSAALPQETPPVSFRQPPAGLSAAQLPPGFVLSNRGVVRADAGDAATQAPIFRAPQMQPSQPVVPPGFVMSNRGIVHADTGEPIENFIPPGYVWSNRGIVRADTGEPLLDQGVPDGYVQSNRGIVSSGMGAPLY